LNGAYGRRKRGATVKTVAGAKRKDLQETREPLKTKKVQKRGEGESRAPASS